MAVFSCCCVWATSVAEATSKFPSALVDQIRTQHLHHTHFRPGTPLQQAEIYLARDMAESIEELSCIIGLTSDRDFLPETEEYRQWIAARLDAKFGQMPVESVRSYLLRHAHDVFMRQRHMYASPVQIDGLHNSWSQWYTTVLTGYHR